MKRIVAILLSAALMLCLSSCAVMDSLIKLPEGFGTTTTAEAAATTVTTVAPTTTTTAATTATTTAPQETGRLTYLDATTPIYSAPGYHYTYLGTVGQSTNYTIVEGKSIGGEIWGKLKSGRGWVPLSMAPGDITDEHWDVNYTVYLNAGTTIYGTPSPSRAVGTITQTTYYTIIEERVNNSGHWGKLKSGLGWIDLEDQATPTRAPQTSPTTTRTTTRATTRTTTRATTTTTRLDIDSDAYFEEEQIVS